MPEGAAKTPSVCADARWQRLNRSLERVTAVHDGATAKGNSTASAAAAPALHPSDADGIALEAVTEVGGQLGWGCTQALPAAALPDQALLAGAIPAQVPGQPTSAALGSQDATEAPPQHSLRDLDSLSLDHLRSRAPSSPVQFGSLFTDSAAVHPSELPLPSLQEAGAAMDTAGEELEPDQHSAEDCPVEDTCTAADAEVRAIHAILRRHSAGIH